MWPLRYGVVDVLVVDEVVDDELVLVDVDVLVEVVVKVVVEGGGVVLLHVLHKTGHTLFKISSNIGSSHNLGTIFEQTGTSGSPLHVESVVVVEDDPDVEVLVVVVVLVVVIVDVEVLVEVLVLVMQ